MAIDDDNLERDPRFARLVQAAAGEEPPAALDAAILAAARREVGARPQVLGGGEASSPPARAKRNWYVPVSIAAVLVMSVSLVTLVHEEKGDELVQPPRSASAPPKVSAPPPAVEAPAAAPPESAKADVKLRDVTPAKPKVAEEKRVEADATLEAYGEFAKKQRAQSEKTELPADKVLDKPGNARKDQGAVTVMREPGLARETAPVPQAAFPAPARREMQAQDRASAETKPELEASGRLAQERPRSTIGNRGFDGLAGGVASGTPAGAAAPQAPSSPPPDLKAAPEPFPAQASRDAAAARSRSDAERNVARGTIQEAPRAPVATTVPPAPVVAAPRRAAPSTEDTQAQSTPSPAESRVFATPPPAPPGSAKLATPQESKPVARAMEKRPPLWQGLEDQPPVKWLEKIAEFRRDGRQTDADELLAEFRRRFPNHPASAR